MGAKNGYAFHQASMGGEEDAQAFTCVTAQSPVHVPFERDCHWGLHVCAHPLDMTPSRSFRICGLSPGACWAARLPGRSL